MSQGQKREAGGGQPPAASRRAEPGIVTIRCRENGPLVIELPEGGDGTQSDASGPTTPAVRVVDHKGNEFSFPTGKRAVALCRCGLSATRPFCDGTHREQGFQATETAIFPG
jgi:CDGSH-type Zn-finger protein